VYNCSRVMRHMEPHDAGIVPVRLLEYKYKYCRLDMLPHDAGSAPVRRLECKSTCVTSLTEHVTPYHAVLHEEVVPQPALFVHCGPLAALYKSMRMS
jgi:hypothetical protein